MLDTNLKFNLTWFKEVIDLGFGRILSDVVIFGWRVINDEFFTLLMVKIFDITYFEAKYCHKLSNKDICVLFNITKQLKLIEVEGRVARYPGLIRTVRVSSHLSGVREWDEFVRVWRIFSSVRLLTTQDCQYILSVSKLFS